MAGAVDTASAPAPATGPAALTVGNGRTRPDKRSATQLRTMGCVLGLLSRADGSARFTLGPSGFASLHPNCSSGDSSVLCAVYGPTSVRARDEKLDRADVQVLFQPLTGATSTQDKVLERCVRETAESLILTALHPRTSIRIIVQVLADDGPVLATAINAVVLALIDAGIAMQATAAAVTLMVDRDGTLLLDPRDLTVLGVQESQSMHTLVFDATAGDVLAIESTGLFGQEEFDVCHELAKLATDSIHAFMRAAIERKIKKEQGL
ncbi:ribosomal protein S5 domain 2-type protein [Entophlyctis helioformis]|nr:ribosomal protein S5 domain 2-type protein [Entophlyctis helioformis]